MMRFVIDQDDVLTATNKRWLTLYNRDWDDDKTLEDIMGWNWHIWVKPECGMKIYDYLKMPGFFSEMEPVPGAIEGMRYLTEAGHKVMIATATPRQSEYAYNEKLNWVKEHLPFHDASRFTSIHEKNWLMGDIMLDDGSHNLEDFVGISVAMDKPWNRGEDCCEYRVSNWNEFIAIVRQFEDAPADLGRAWARANERFRRVHTIKKERERRYEQG